MTRYSTSRDFNNSINSFKSRCSFISGRHDLEHDLKFFVSTEGTVPGVVCFIGFSKCLEDLDLSFDLAAHEKTLHEFLCAEKLRRETRSFSLSHARNRVILSFMNSTAKVKPIPEGYHTLTPYLFIQGASAAIDFYKKAFNATEIM